MSYFIITYDLYRPGQNYQPLRDAIESYPNIHPMESVYFILSGDSAVQIFDHLNRFIDSNDKLFVGEIGDWKADAPGIDFLNGR